MEKAGNFSFSAFFVWLYAADTFKRFFPKGTIGFCINKEDEPYPDSRGMLREDGL